MSSTSLPDDEGAFAREVAYRLPAEVAVVDESGVILSTNLAWRLFGEENGLAGADMRGQNYLAVCDAAAATEPDAATASRGIRDVLRGERDAFSLEYPCHSPNERRWFLMRVVPLGFEGRTYALVVHLDVTERKLTELEVKTRTNQFEAIATLLSVDLAGSLSEALGRTVELSETIDSHEYIALEASLQQMNAFVTDALALLRGDPVDTVHVDLEASARAAWGRIETFDATLVVDSSRVFQADLGLVHRLFHHLYQHALALGGAAVAVRVGVDDEKLYVEYECEPAEPGESASGAAGRGGPDPNVAVATRIAEVHGWSLATTTGETIRHEISGIRWRRY